MLACHVTCKIAHHVAAAGPTSGNLNAIAALPDGLVWINGLGRVLAVDDDGVAIIEFDGAPREEPFREGLPGVADEIRARLARAAAAGLPTVGMSSSRIGELRGAAAALDR